MTRVRLIFAASLALILLWAGASGAAASPVTPAGTGTASASASAVTSGLKGLKPGQKKARAKQLKRCRKQRVKAKRKSCVKRVKSKYHRLAKKQRRKGSPDSPAIVAPTAVHEVWVTDNGCDVIQSSCFLPIRNGVRDPFVFGEPNALEIRVGEAVRFVWDDHSRDSAHNVSLWSHPDGVSSFDYEMSGTATVGTTFQRTFRVPGGYQFRCSLHQLTQILNLTVTS